VFADSAYVVTEVTPHHLLVTVPGSSLGSSWLSLVLLVIFLVMTYATSRTVWRLYQQEKSPEALRAYVWRYRVLGMGIGCAGLGVFWLVGYSSGSIELDRRSNLATMRAKFTAFLPAETGSVPLSDVDKATLDAKPNARRIRLVTNDGAGLGYPLWSDRQGQAEAVRAINRFLACSGCDVGGEPDLTGGKARGGVSYRRAGNDKVQVWSRDIAACHADSGAAGVSFGTGFGVPILTIIKSGNSAIVVLQGPEGSVTFNEQQCRSVELELPPSTPASSRTREMNGHANVTCKNDVGSLNVGIRFERCGQ
jgi:hypothetical protein